MALKRQQNMLAAFSMASMTDVIFLLLVFFMVTSTFVFPTALEVNLPEGSEQASAKPSTRVFVDADGGTYLALPDDAELRPLAPDSIMLSILALDDSTRNLGVAVYADSAVAYGKVVEVLNLGAVNSLKMVLATRPSASTPSQQ